MLSDKDKGLSNKEKVEFLMKEKEITRQEIYMYVKANLTMMFSYITILGAFLGFYYGKIDICPLYKNYILLIAEQLGYCILVLNLNLHSSIGSLAGYIRSIEERINFYAGEDISQWETKIVYEYYRKIKNLSGAQISTFFITFLLGASFLFYAIIIQILFGGYIFILLHSFEFIFLLILAKLSLSDRNKSYEFTKMNQDNE